jgi:hypothetical protein
MGIFAPAQFPARPASAFPTKHDVQSNVSLAAAVDFISADTDSRYPFLTDGSTKERQ